MQTSHDSNGQTTTSSISGNATGGGKLHGGDLNSGGHETMVSPVASAAAVGALTGVSSASVMGAPGAASYGAQLGTTTQMLSGGDNYSGYQSMFPPDYLPQFGMYSYYGNHSQGLGDASAATAAPQSSLWSGAGTGAGSTTQNDLSLSFLNFHTAPGGAPSYQDYYYPFNAAQQHYNTWGQPTASSAAPLDYTDLAAGWGQALGGPTPNSAPHEANYTTGGTGGTSNGSALLKEFSAANSVSVSQQQQQQQQQQQNNSNMFVNGSGLPDFSVPTSGREPPTVTSSEMCGALEQSFSQFGLGGHSPSTLIPSPPQMAQQPAAPQVSIRSDDSHFPGLGASVPASVSQPLAQPVSSVSTVAAGGGGGGGKKTWASIASQPAKGSAATLGVIPGPGSRKLPGPGLGPPKPPGRGTPTVLRPNMPWESTGGGGAGHGNVGKSGGSRGRSVTTQSPSTTAPGVLFTNEELASKNFNPRTFDLNPKNAKFFVIKSYSEDDIHRSIKYQIWCSTEHGNKKLDAAFHEMDSRGPVYLFFSVNGSGHFCGVAQMASRVDYDTRAGVWCQDKWKGEFRVKWIYVKDVPNSQLRHIRLETNENKPVTNSRDATEVPLEKGRLVLKVIHTYKHTTSIFDDFSHYERREEQENQKRNNGGPAIGAGSNTFSH